MAKRKCILFLPGIILNPDITSNKFVAKYNKNIQCNIYDTFDDIFKKRRGNKPISNFIKKKPNICCMLCGCNLKDSEFKYPITIPKMIDFDTYGEVSNFSANKIFDSFPCAVTWINREFYNQPEEKFSNMQSLNFYYKLLFGNYPIDIFTEAEDIGLMQKYGGNLSEYEYQKKNNKFITSI